MSKKFDPINLMAKDALLRCFNVYGIEGTLEKIHSVCDRFPEMKEIHLRNFYELLGVKRKN